MAGSCKSTFSFLKPDDRLKLYPRGINMSENILVVWKASGTDMQMQSVIPFAKSSSFCKETVWDVAIWKGILDLA